MTPETPTPDAGTIPEGAPLSSAPVTLSTGETVTLQKIRFGDMAAERAHRPGFLAAVNGIFGGVLGMVRAMDAPPAPDAPPLAVDDLPDVGLILAENNDAVCAYIGLYARRPAGWVADLDPADVVALMGVTARFESRFFIDHMIPSLTGFLAGVAPAEPATPAAA